MLVRSEPNLWTLIAAPMVWAGHFLACYLVAAVFCAKAGTGIANLATVRLVIGTVTLVAVLLIVLCGRQAYHHWGFGISDPPHDAGTAEDRRRFLGYAALLLCALSLVSVLFVALPALAIPDCR
jgi:hypothetical protein